MYKASYQLGALGKKILADQLYTMGLGELQSLYL